MLSIPEKRDDNGSPQKKYSPRRKMSKKGSKSPNTRSPNINSPKSKVSDKSPRFKKNMTKVNFEIDEKDEVSSSFASNSNAKY